jgi:hypothetical protein
MVTLLPYFISSLIPFAMVLFIFYSNSKKKRKKRDIKHRIMIIVMQCVFISLTAILYAFFIMNLESFTSKPSSIIEMAFIGCSQLLLASSSVLFVYTFKSPNRFELIMECPSKSESKIGNINIGRIIDKNKVKHKFKLNIDDLAQHMFICGTTGTGKSNFLQQFLLNFTKKYDIPFLLTEFKGEYHFLQEKIDNLLILKPGENFSINIFDPEGADPYIHAERVFKIFESGGLLENVDYSPQMERVFIDILYQICPKEENRSWGKFFSEFEKYYAKQEDFTMKKSVQAIRNRIRRYSVSTLKNIFDKKSGLNVKELFNHRVLLDLSSIIRKGGEKEDALFFLNMVLKYLWDKNIETGSKNYEGIKHITIIEDAQYFAPQELSSRTKLTSYIEDIALLLRGTGECLISLATRPNISREILANCGVLVSFQVHLQKDLMQELLNLKDWQKEYLSMLKRGQCLIRINSIEKPFAMETVHIKRSWLSNEEIVEKNEEILERTRNQKEAQKEVKSPEEKNVEKKSFCKFCGKEIKQNSDYCELCSVKLEEEDKRVEEFDKFIDKLLLTEGFFEETEKYKE